MAMVMVTATEEEEEEEAVTVAEVVPGVTVAVSPHALHLATAPGTAAAGTKVCTEQWCGGSSRMVSGTKDPC